MRTTIELSPDQRAVLLELAARRGLKGFSTLIQEAIELYLRELARREASITDALSVIGSLDDESADALTDAMRRARESWR